ncbi:MAG: hypothetical protein ACKO4U_06410 [Caldilinea sp.]
MQEGIKTLQQRTAHDLRRYLVSLSRRELSSQYQNNLARAIPNDDSLINLIASARW